MSIMDYVRNRNVPRLAGPEEDLDEQFRVELTNNLRSTAPRPNEFVPDYSIERAESFLSRHIEEISVARATLAVEIASAEAHLAELKRRQGVTTIVHDALAETLAKLSTPKQEQAEEGFPS